MTKRAARFVDVTHVYGDPADPSGEGVVLTALHEVDLSILPGEAVALVGPSGAGKSTMLTLLAGLAKPTDGHVFVGNQVVSTMSERALLRLRARDLGIVLQTPARNLLPYATALQNVVFAHRQQDVRGRRARRERASEARRLLDEVGLSDHLARPARLLSGGQQQRLAVAVALAGHPGLLIVDEPTSQLPRETGDGVVRLLLQAREEYGAALLVVTHDPRVADALDTVYRLTDGQLHAGTTPAEAR